MAMARPQEGPVRFKCIYGDEKRILFLPQPVTLAELQGKIHELYPGNLAMYYVDVEDDFIVLKTDSDLQHALQAFLRTQRFSFKLVLTDGQRPAAGQMDSWRSMNGDPAGTVTRPVIVRKARSIRNEFREHKLAEEVARREQDSHALGLLASGSTPGRRPSPPPGFLETESRQRTPTNSGSFNNINGGGEFIPEHDHPEEELRLSSSVGRNTVRSIASITSYSSISSAGSSGSLNSHRGSRLPREEDLESGVYDANAEFFGQPPLRSRSETFPRDIGRQMSTSAPDSSTLGGGNPSTFPRIKNHLLDPADDGLGSLRDSQHSDLALQQRDIDYEVALERLRDLSMVGSDSKSRPVVARAPKRWQRGKFLGAGAFGQVYLALDMDSGAELAVKQVSLHPEAGTDNLKEVQSLEAEIALLKNLRHERIVLYYGTERSHDNLTIFMEYVAGRSIHNRLRDYGIFSEDVVRKYTRQVLEGLEYLHAHRIVHRDIKGANVLVDGQGNVKVADFGASKRLQTIKTMTGFKSVHGTPYWMSPEVINGCGYGRKSDIWSTGALIIEMFTGAPPFAEYEYMAALFKIGQADTDFGQVIPAGISPQAKHILQRCFSRSTFPLKEEVSMMATRTVMGVGRRGLSTARAWQAGAHVFDIKDAADFEDKVIKASHPVIVDFTATWCPPCKMLAPVLEKAVNARAGKVTLAKVDIDHNQDLAMKYSVSSIPHVCAFIGGKPTANFVGAVPESAVEEFINSALAK